MSDWIKIQNCIITDDIQQVHCDTRDFFAVCRVDMYDEKEMSSRPWWKVRNDPRFHLKQEDVIPFLRKLEEITGGEGSWRMMNFRNIKTAIGWFKYVRLYRVSPTHFIVTDGTYATNVSKLTEDNLEKEILCFSKHK